MKTLCKIIGGSHLYGLNTPASDIDERYVFIHDDVARTIGLDRFEHQDGRGGDEDKFGFEIRHFMNLLRRANTQVLEIIFANDYIECDEKFRELVINNRFRLIDSEKMYKSLRGYIQGERLLANGERTGTLGKRKDAIEKYGFSPKNFVQLFRLAYVGKRFFRDNIFAVNIMKDNEEFGKQLLSIKTQPELFSKKQLNEMVDVAEAELTEAYEKATIFTFNTALANDILLELYHPIIVSLKEEKDKEFERVRAELVKANQIAREDILKLYGLKV